MEYPKTENLFARDPDTHELTSTFKCPEFPLVKEWVVSEKINGTNCRVVYRPDDAEVLYLGRSDRAQLPPDLTERMEELLPLEKLKRQFAEFMQRRPGSSVTLFGEGYGAGIQKGGGYSPNKQFRIFDVCYHWNDPTALDGVHDSWAQPSTTHWIADGLDVPHVPVHGVYSIERITTLVMNMTLGNVPSETAWEDSENEHVPEGIVARTDPYLYTHRGSRVMFKLKTADLS